MFERFTDRAKRVVVLAQEEARIHNHNYIGTEHILLGLVHEGEGVAAKALELLRIALDEVRNQVDEIIGEGEHPPVGFIPFTPRAKKVLELSLREALLLGHGYIGTEHILLGMIREGEGVAAQVLTKLGADLNGVRQQVLPLLSGYYQSELKSQLADVSKARVTATENNDIARVAKLLGLENCLQSLLELDNKILSVQLDKFSTQDSAQALELREQEEALHNQRAELNELRQMVAREVNLEPESADDANPPETPTDVDTSPPSVRVFISYRREQTSHFAGRISDWLIRHLGANQVFMDVDSIELGVDFEEVITDAVGQCDVLVAVIGPQWATASNESGKRRLTLPGDIVRLEVEAALKRRIRVIPVLVDGAEMPQRELLPKSLAALARRNALTIRHASFRQDVERLIRAVDQAQ